MSSSLKTQRADGRGCQGQARHCQGVYLRSLYQSATMGPSVRLNTLKF